MAPCLNLLHRLSLCEDGRQKEGGELHHVEFFAVKER